MITYLLTYLLTTTGDYFTLPRPVKTSLSRIVKSPFVA